MDNDEQLKQWT